MRVTESTFRASTVVSLCYNYNGYNDHAVFDRCIFDSLRCNLSFETRACIDPDLVAEAARRLLHGNHVVSALGLGRHEDDEVGSWDGYEGEEEVEMDCFDEEADEDAHDDEDAEEYADE